METKTELKSESPLKTMITSESRIDSQVQTDMILADNQVRYVMPRAVTTVNQRHYIRQYAQKTEYNPGEQITFILNSGDLFVNAMNSYLVFQCGVLARNVAGTTYSDSIPCGDARLGSAGALGLINRCIITSASGAEVVNMNYANGFYQTNLHYNYDDNYLETIGRSMGVKSVDTKRSYGVVAPLVTTTGTDVAALTSVSRTTSTIAPPGFMYNPRINTTGLTPSTVGTLSTTVTTSIAYATTSAMVSTVDGTAATGIASVGQLPYPFAPNSAGFTSQMMPGSVVTYDPNQSYYGMRSTLPQAQATASFSTTFCGGVQNNGSGAAATVSGTGVALQTPYSVDTSLKRRYVGASVIHQTGATTGGLRPAAPYFVIPLHQISGLFNTDKLIVPTLGASLRIDLFLEQSDVALQWTGAIPTSASHRQYTISNPTIMLDTLMMNELVSKKIFAVSAETGLDFDFSDVNNTTQTYTSDGEQTLDNKIAVSRAEYAFVKFRDTIAMQSASTTSAVYDSMMSTVLPPFTYYQWNLGGLFLPQDNLRTFEEMYYNALFCFNKTELNGKPMNPSVTFEEFLCGGYNIISCNLERSSLIRLTGMPVSSSRTLTARVNMTLPYLTSFLGGGTPSTTQSAQRADMYLVYRALLKIFPTKVVKRI